MYVTTTSARDRKMFGNVITYGVFLSEKRGNCNGYHQNEFFFKCPSGHGAFVPERRIKSEATEEDIEFVLTWIKENIAGEAADEAKLKDWREEIDKLRNAFMKHDGDGSQSLDLAEFISLAQTEGFSSEQASELYAQVDTSNNGSISLAELDAFIKKEAEDKEATQLEN